ncbi:DUF1515 family protein [Ensifer sp. 4252]|uniref:DUF1515 family protein n=1 Tax=Ensifer sp. 4252 TaxID=3373915 RepID=UPI003D21F78A
MATKLSRTAYHGNRASLSPTKRWKLMGTGALGVTGIPAMALGVCFAEARVRHHREGFRSKRPEPRRMTSFGRRSSLHTIPTDHHLDRFLCVHRYNHKSGELFQAFVMARCQTAPSIRDTRPTASAPRDRGCHFEKG